MFGVAFRSTPRRFVRALAWTSNACCLVMVPGLSAMWLWVMAAEGGHWTHIFAHNQFLIMPVFLSALFSGSFYCVNDYAVMLREGLGEVCKDDKVGLGWAHTNYRVT